MIIQYRDKKECCGCYSCMNICPTDAISMVNDEMGFGYPKIDTEKCIECGLCLKVCDFQNENNVGLKPSKVYGAVNKDVEKSRESSSAGVFTSIANYVLNNGGLVIGCAFRDDLRPIHTIIENKNDIYKIKGSKYVQSDLDFIHRKIKNYLKEDRLVLFSGTPCQVGGLRGYLRYKDYDKLILVDIVCHGIPSYKFFNGYIQYLENKHKGKIEKISFRDKKKGWGHSERIWINKNGEIKEKSIPSFNSYYHKFFLSGDSFRDSCYNCKYTNEKRMGDITLGDFWGVDEFYPEIDSSNGVSLVMLNTPKGEVVFEEIKDYYDIFQSTFEIASKHNGQLKKPKEKGKYRDEVFESFEKNGYVGANDVYMKYNRKRVIVDNVKSLFPKDFREKIKAIIRK